MGYEWPRFRTTKSSLISTVIVRLLHSQRGSCGVHEPKSPTSNFLHARRQIAASFRRLEVATTMPHKPAKNIAWHRSLDKDRTSRPIRIHTTYEHKYTHARTGTQWPGRWSVSGHRFKWARLSLVIAIHRTDFIPPVIHSASFHSICSRLRRDFRMDCCPCFNAHWIVSERGLLNLRYSCEINCCTHSEGGNSENSLCGRPSRSRLSRILEAIYPIKSLHRYLNPIVQIYSLACLGLALRIGEKWCNMCKTDRKCSFRIT